MLDVKQHLRSVTALALFGVGLALSQTVVADPDGRSGYSGETRDCTNCHDAGAAVPTVTLNGPNTVEPGSINSYSFTMEGGPAVDAGLDISATGGTIIDTNASGTKILSGELVQSTPNPMNGSPITWTFNWQAPQTAGTYTLYAAGLSANGTGGTGNDGTGTTTLQITVTAPVNQDPTAVIDGPATGTEGVAVTFDGSGSSDPDGTIEAYDWDFGDNSAGSGVSVSHTYAVGTYTITLTVTDDAGATASTTATITIEAPPPPPPNESPVAVISGPNTGTEGVAVTFDGSGSSDADGTIASYDWDFGDNSSGSGVSATHTYTAGSYNVVLTVTDNEGATGSDTLTIDIAAPTDPQAPVADAGGPYAGTEGEAIQFDGSGSMDADGSITSYDWDFGDTTTGTGVGPNHVYTTAGTYTVVLTVTDNDGMTGSSQTTAVITAPEPPPEPPVEPPIEPPVPPDTDDGEELYNSYCANCHGDEGTGGKDGDVVGESAEDIEEAIEDEKEMRFLGDILSSDDIQAIADYLESLDTGDDDDKDGHHGDGDRCDNKGHDGDKKDGHRGRDRDSDDCESDNPFKNRSSEATVGGASADEGGGGSLHWLSLAALLLWPTYRVKSRA